MLKLVLGGVPKDLEFALVVVDLPKNQRLVEWLALPNWGSEFAAEQALPAAAASCKRCWLPIEKSWPVVPGETSGCHSIRRKTVVAVED